MRTHRNRLRRLAGLGVLIATVGLTGCDLDELLTIEDRDTVNPGTLEDPATIDVLITGAIGDFVDAFDGDQDSYTTVTALFSDEFFSSGTFTTRTATDRRDQFTAANGNTSDATYVELQFARRSLMDVAERVAAHEDYGPTSDTYAELKALEGYTIVLLGEVWCSSVPFSYLVGPNEYEYGQPNTTSQVYDSAMVRLQASTSAAANDLAAIGRARALLNQGQYDAAAAAVAGVDTDFNYFVFHSVSAQTNPVWNAQGNGRFSQSDTEGGTGAAFRSAGDPRSPFTDDADGDGEPDGGFDDAYPLFTSLKYPLPSSPTVLASGVEARLIEAEAELQNGDYVGMTTILNTLRADVDDIMGAWVPGYDPDPLAPLVAPLTQAAARDMLFEERAFWLFLTGHRMGDMRRLVYQYGLTEDEVYPTGSYHKGGSYGDDVVFQIDFDESNNPNYDLASCTVTDAGIN